MKILIDMQGVQTESRYRGIGRYCLAVTRALLESSGRSHETTLLFNAALDGIDQAVDALSGFGARARRRAVGAIRNTSSHNRTNDARRSAAERVFTHAINMQRPDVVWLSSVVEGFTDDALVPDAAPDALTVATLYDLIPLHDDEYLGNSRSRDWYMRRIEVLKRCDMLFAISEWVRTDAIERLGVEPERIVSIGAGVESHFTAPSPGADHTRELKDRFGITLPFVMYNGGFDKRKNVLALIEAYAALSLAVRDEHALVIVGRIDPLFFERVAERMAALGLRSADVVFTGYVSDAELVQLYQSCAVFVFPSEREGFGLAPLEAMACGAPTLVNDATSLPEVVENTDALFDANQPEAMAARIEAVLTDAAFAARLRQTGLQRAAHFSWRSVASRALEAMQHGASLGVRARRDPARESRTPFPLYRINAGNIAATLPLLRRWPGHAVWSGPLPHGIPLGSADRYRLGGYAHLGIPSSSTDWAALLEIDAIGVVYDDGLSDAAIEARFDELRMTHPLARQRDVEIDIAGESAPLLSDDDLACVADALTRATPYQPARWLIDVTHIATKDLGTGVHRVVRSILREWLTHPPGQVRIEPIAFRDGRFYHAHSYACQLIGVDVSEPLPGDLVAITGDEVYIGLDWAMESLPSSEILLRMWRRAGVPIHFIVYDLLPLTMPDAFHQHSYETFVRWMDTIIDLGDALHCISHASCDDVERWIDGRASSHPPTITSFELGSDVSQLPQEGVLDSVLDSAMAMRPSLAMVGTVEPRKGHVQVLDALELLWESGADVNLVIVGHRGWLVKDLIRRLEGHAEVGKRLFWIDDADDGVLEAIYRRMTVLVAASRGEGHALPIIEAAQRGKPVIARSLPVFREVAGEYPSYFDTEAAEGLATHIARWMVHRPPPGPHPPWRTWKESAASLERVVNSSLR